MLALDPEVRLAMAGVMVLVAARFVGGRCMPTLGRQTGTFGEKLDGAVLVEEDELAVVSTAWPRGDP